MKSPAIVDAPLLRRFFKMAVMAGVESAVRLHIDRGDDPNARDEGGLTPLMLAAARNKHAICNLLLGAGADPLLLDPSGRSAHGIAVEAGALEAAVVIGSIEQLKLPSNQTSPEVQELTEPTKVEDAAVAETNFATASSAQEMDAAADVTLTEPAVLRVQPGLMAVEDIEADSGFDWGGWEPEERRPPPEMDFAVSRAAIAVQAAISKFEPFDTSSDWDDFDTYLPERSTPLPRAGDEAARALLRLLLLRAYREGSVPLMAIEDMASNDDGVAKKETELILSMAINDLGAEVDERFEYVSPFESFEVYVKAEETIDEEAAISGALAFVDDVLSSRNDPLRFYQREIQRERLLSASQEVEFGKAMENGLERALDALAAWPTGIGKILEGAQKVKSGEWRLGWMSLGPLDETSDIEADSELDSMHASVSEEIDGEVVVGLAGEERAAHTTKDPFDFLGSVNKLHSLPNGEAKGCRGWQEIRTALASLRLTRRFILELADFTNAEETVSAREFSIAVRDYRIARDGMTISNLKLVFNLALKWRFSGEPLDDLIQEGNLGLLKAVERYDWRRGFKFSTYAIWWIRQHISRHIADKCRTVRLPVHMYEKLNRVERESQALEVVMGRPPSLEEIAARVDMPPEKVVDLLRIAPEPESIDVTCIDDRIVIDVNEQFPDHELRVSINRLLGTLTPKEEEILRMRFGMGEQDAMTLEDIGAHFKVTRERIRQIEAKAIKKLKHPSRRVPLSLDVFGFLLPANEKEQATASEHDGAYSVDDDQAKPLRGPRPAQDGTLPRKGYRK